MSAGIPDFSCFITKKNVEMDFPFFGMDFKNVETRRKYARE